mmetsp:Transcript_4353/g.9798  ORF Transcript_4353/g.9798 Transcript_4353/m.9798 type:complete len:111 (+) Transcript_4353:894-1226(+)
MCFADRASTNNLTKPLRLRSQKYLACLKESRDVHHKCRDFSKEYLQCRMDHQLMSRENLDEMGFSEEQRVVGATEYDKSKEREGYVAGKHIQKPGEWWWSKKGKKDWTQS